MKNERKRRTNQNVWHFLKKKKASKKKEKPEILSF